MQSANAKSSPPATASEASIPVVNPRLRVLVAEFATERHQLRQALPSFTEIVGEANRCDEALELFYRTRPDVVIAAVSLPEHGGFHLLRSIIGVAADCAVVLTCRVCHPFVYQAAALLGAFAVCPAGNEFIEIRGILDGLKDRQLPKTAL